jgi:hypothetical protein
VVALQKAACRSQVHAETGEGLLESRPGVESDSGTVRHTAGILEENLEVPGESWVDLVGETGSRGHCLDAPEVVEPLDELLACLSTYFGVRRKAKATSEGRQRNISTRFLRSRWF